MYTLVFDANVPWDLDIKINRLNEIMHLMDNINFKIYISYINFNEMPYGVQRNLRNHAHVVIKNEPVHEYDAFEDEIHLKGINLCHEDSAVLYMSHKVDADFIISSDRRLLLMVKKYAKSYGKKVRPFHLIQMFSLLRGMSLIEPNVCIKMIFKLYQNKEILRMIEEHGAELIINKIERNEWIRNEIKSSVDTFNIYDQHLIGHLR